MTSALGRRVAPWLWGALVAAWVCRPYFALGPGEMPINHEKYDYVRRIVEFRDLLHAGYLFPTWAVDFRGGLGSPYFGYYQPGFFYLASALAFVLPVTATLATTLWILSILGYGGLFVLVRARFGALPGVLAGTVLLASPYVRTELYLRGDFSEFTGRMLLAPALHWLTSWLDLGRRRSWAGLAAGAAGLVCAHPVTGLLGYGALVVTTGCWLATGGDGRRAAAAIGALAAGVGLAAFYLAPVALEWNLVQGSRLTAVTSDVTLDFVGLDELVGLSPGPDSRPIPVGLGAVVLGLAAFAVGSSIARWRDRGTGQRRLLLAVVVGGLGAAWLAHSSSEPLWKMLALLRFVQFPWRALLVVTVLLAVASGCVVEGARVVVPLGIAACLASTYGAETLAVRRWPYSDDPRALAREWVAPDVASEWLPRNARDLRGANVPTAPTCSGVCHVDAFERDTAGLRVRVTVAGDAELVLPHYYFPVGWRATLDGDPVPIERTDQGLMRIALARSGTLDVRFGRTPARGLGVAVSTATLGLLAGLAGLSRGRTRARPHSTVAPRPV